MAANDTAQLAVNGVVGGEAHVHTLHFRHIIPGLTEADLIDAWQANCRTEYRNLFVNTDSPCVRYVARQVCGSVPLRAPAEESEVAPNIVGANVPSGERVPTWLAGVTTVRTPLGGKERRGRFYIGGLYEVQVVGNELTSAHQAGIQAYANKLIATFKSGGTLGGSWQLVVHSRKLAQPGILCENSSTLVASMRTNLMLGSMKSRKPGSGS